MKAVFHVCRVSVCLLLLLTVSCAAHRKALQGVYSLPREAISKRGILELKDARFRYWGDVTQGRDVTPDYPICGKYFVFRKWIFLRNEELSCKRLLLGTHRNTKLLWKMSAVWAWRKHRTIDTDGVLVRVDHPPLDPSVLSPPSWTSVFSQAEREHSMARISAESPDGSPSLFPRKSR